MAQALKTKKIAAPWTCQELVSASNVRNITEKNTPEIPTEFVAPIFHAANTNTREFRYTSKASQGERGQFGSHPDQMRNEAHIEIQFG